MKLVCDDKNIFLYFATLDLVIYSSKDLAWVEKDLKMHLSFLNISQ